MRDTIREATIQQRGTDTEHGMRGSQQSEALEARVFHIFVLGAVGVLLAEAELDHVDLRSKMLTVYVQTASSVI